MVVDKMLLVSDKAWDSNKYEFDGGSWIWGGARYYGVVNKFHFQFDSTQELKKEVALKSIHFPSFVIPQTYRFYILWGLDGHGLLHGIKVKLARIINSANDIVWEIYKAFKKYLEDGYRDRLEFWEKNSYKQWKEAFPIGYDNGTMWVNLAQIPIKIITDKEKLNELRWDELNVNSSTHFTEPNIMDLFKNFPASSIVKKALPSHTVLLIQARVYTAKKMDGYNYRINDEEIVIVPGYSLTNAFIKCNIIKPVLINSQWEQILEVVNLNGSQKHNKVEIHNPTFHKVNVESIVDVRLEIESTDGKRIPFNDTTPIIFELIFR